MHVGRCDSDVAQGRNAKASLAGRDERGLDLWRTGMRDRSGKVELVMSTGTAAALGIEKCHAAPLCGVEVTAVVVEYITVEGGTARDQRALEARQGTRQVGERDRARIAREGAGERRGIARVRGKLAENERLAAGEAHLDRMLVHERLHRLRLERCEARIGPRIHRVVG